MMVRRRELTTQAQDMTPAEVETELGKHSR
jgi:hypothetical protein